MTAKKVFNRIGFSLLATAGCVIAVQLLLGFVIGVLDPDGSVCDENGWLTWAVSFAPVYLLAFPLGFLLMKDMPTDHCEQLPLGCKNFFVILLVCFPMMYGGNLIGSGLSVLLSGGTAQNPLLDFAFDTSPTKLLVMIVLAPLFEEFFFRKTLIDRTARYGEKNAILFSAIAFALFHMNLYQVFYAFGIGLVLGYVYLRTRRMRYTFLLHMVINLLGSVVAPLILSNLDMDALERMSVAGIGEAALAEMLPGIIAFMIYALFMIGASIAGLILLLKYAPRLTFLTADDEISKGQRLTSVFLNAGMVLFVLLCVVICVINLFQ